MLMPDMEASKIPLSEMNGISRWLGGAAEFRLVDSTLPFNQTSSPMGTNCNRATRPRASDSGREHLIGTRRFELGCLPGIP